LNHAADVLELLCGSGKVRSKKRGLRAKTKLTNISIQSSYSMTWNMQDKVKPTKVGDCAKDPSTHFRITLDASTIPLDTNDLRKQH